MTDYVAVAIDYALRCADGREVCGKYTRLAALRFLADVQTSAADKAWRWRLDPEKAARPCRFLERISQVDGSKWAGQLLRLSPWQVFFVVNIFGWVDEHGHRRFQTILLEVARKNGKSFLLSALAIYLLVADNEPGAQVYSAATTDKQARVIWSVAFKIVKRMRTMREHFGIGFNQEAIYHEASGSTFVPIPNNPENQDGLNVHAALIDELHRHENSELWNVLDTARGAREQPLLIAITTAGIRINENGPWWQQRRYLQALLDGEISDDRYFGVIYHLDDDDDVYDSTLWQKANPNLRVSKRFEDIEDYARRARRLGGHTFATFCAYHCGRPVDADQRWIPAATWTASEVPATVLDEVSGLPCWMGWDLSSRRDFTAIARWWRGADERGREIWTLDVQHFAPEGALGDHPDHLLLEAWARDGYLTVLPGPVLEEEWIEDELLHQTQANHPHEVAYDPWHSEGMARRLAAKGVPVIEVSPSAATLSPPMNSMADLLSEGRARVVRNPVTAWQARNVVAHPDRKGNVYPRKDGGKDSPHKIDGIVCAIATLGRALAADLPPPPPPESVYDERGALIL
jgi:phage terminase large subunit-like protein